MKKMKTTTCNVISPNYGKAQYLAYKTVQNSGQNKLPLSIKKLIRSFPNISLQKYTVFAKRRELSMEEVYAITNSEEGCLWMNGKNKFIILYNDTKKNTKRIRFTLAHELGHYILKHNRLLGKTKLSRYSLSSEEYDVFEKEANYFAKRLLAPIPLVDLYVANWERIMATNIVSAFDTSYTVADRIIEDLHRRYERSMITQEKHPMTENFIDFINRDSNSKICTNCSGLQSREHKFCMYCRGTSFIQSSPKNYVLYYKKRSKTMIYSKIKTNEEGTPYYCPRCGAQELDNNFKYCPYCSIYIHNVCLGNNENYYNGWQDDSTERSIQQQFEDNNCSKKYLDGGFRYCPECGEKTSYNRQGLLEEWNIERQQQLQKLGEDLDKEDLQF
ncbi:ImmA/IrrE family metallo-endopeptidase [Listeria monocytogenes]|nr:ImmA/IrrE family metallo-endopeptidase [Listeria monocytogenes]